MLTQAGFELSGVVGQWKGHIVQGQSQEFSPDPGAPWPGAASLISSGLCEASDKRAYCACPGCLLGSPEGQARLKGPARCSGAL